MTQEEQQADEESVKPLETDAYAGLGEHDDLAPILSRLAGLKGVAVPKHRFAYQMSKAEQLSYAEMSTENRLSELWLARFPDGFVKRVKGRSLKKADFPYLWASDSGDRVYVVRGEQHDGYVVESAAGDVETLPHAGMVDGSWLRLEVSENADEAAKKRDFSAKQWFSFAIRKHRGVFFEAVFATFMVSVFGLTSAMYTMQVYDRVVPTQGFSTLWVLTIGVALAIAFELAMKLVRTHMVDKACKYIDIELSSVFFGKAMDIRADARPRTVGTFASQIRHFESVRNFMTSSTLFILADLPFALFFIGVIYLIAGPVAYVPMAIIPLSFLIGFAMKGPVERYTQEHQEESNKKNGLLIEAIDGFESIKAANAEWKLLNRWRELTATISQSELKTRLLSAASSSAAQSIQQVSYVGIIATGAYAISNGDLTMGGLIACSIISGRALTPLTQFPNLIVQWKNAQIALSVLDNIMAMPSESTAERIIVPDVCKGAIDVKDLSFAYGENMPTVEIPKLSLRAGDRVAILGTVGSGKSTLIKILAGLYQAKEGKVFLDGVDLTQVAPDFIREHMGYLPQDVRLFNGTLRDNLVLGLPALSDSQILRAAGLTGLDAAIRNHPMGLEIPISEGGKGLSGGQRQLVGLTRLLLARPDILMLDEPTASMDASAETRVMKHLFEELPENATVLVATHKAGVLKYVNRLIVMEAGRILMDGPKDAVIAKLNEQAAAQLAAQGQKPAVDTAGGEA
jgi:ATP-binding cassette subfamily C protein LapB